MVKQYTYSHMIVIYTVEVDVCLYTHTYTHTRMHTLSFVKIDSASGRLIRGMHAAWWSHKLAFMFSK
jgi:hypothetical protein